MNAGGRLPVGRQVGWSPGEGAEGIDAPRRSLAQLGEHIDTCIDGLEAFLLRRSPLLVSDVRGNDQQGRELVIIAVSAGGLERR